METRQILEAILFVAENPVPTEELAQVLELPAATIRKELEGYGQELDEIQRGFVLREVGGGWRLYTRPEARPYLERFASAPTATRLSQAALETLAVVAYRQPVSRGQVGEIRGVDSERSIRTLERHGLIAEVGHAPGPGAAILYGTTDIFLEKLGVNSTDELPPLAEHVPPAEVVEALEAPFRPEQPSSGSRS